MALAITAVYLGAVIVIVGYICAVTPRIKLRKRNSRIFLYLSILFSFFIASEYSLRINLEARNNILLITLYSSSFF
jgi:hypothetical protein